MANHCEYCEELIPTDEIEYAKERQARGYFCEVCEYFHYFDVTHKRPAYKLFLEQSTQQNDARILEKPPVALSKRMSPLRYPGGKTRLIDFMYHEMDTSGTQTLYSPFAGGASLELAMLNAGVVKHVVLNDLDAHLMNFYRVVFNKTEALIQTMQDNPLTIALYETAHELVVAPFDAHDAFSPVTKAYYYLVNNRCSFSGIYKAGRSGGKNGNLKALSSRWNPTNLMKRIKTLGTLADKVTLTEMSYEAFTETYAWEPDGVFIIDPPYVEKAKGIYRHAFELEEHRALFAQITSFWHSHPACDFFVFYDDHPHLYDLLIPTDVEVIARKFSIANAPKQTKGSVALQ